MANSKYNNLIILDWDDTLFPTSWTLKHNITNDKYYAQLDDVIYHLLSNLAKYGQIMIITNASIKWFDMTVIKLPKTNIMIKNKISVLSARDIYRDQYPDNINVWKTMLFKQVVTKYFDGVLMQNIVSVGDDVYEFDATVNLYNGHSVIKNRILKTIRLIKKPSLKDMVKQIQILDINIDNIMGNCTHSDIRFGYK